MTEDVRNVETKVVACDGTGSGDTLGHPKVYLNVGKDGRVECPYCSRLFVYDGSNGSDH